MVSYRGLPNPLRKEAASFTSVVSRSSKQQTGDSKKKFGSVSSPLLREKNPLGGVRANPSLFPFHQLLKSTLGIPPMPHRHYIFTNIYALSWIRTQALPNKNRRH
ncbi:hypothetical protein TNCV_3274371 [Trichonephila clavipes]|nr:hypothetical protein TNCV_3274371 [Trichonephila clavipes]